MTRILLAGGTGVIGRRLVPPLLAAGHDVTAISRHPERRRWVEEAGARLVEAAHSTPIDSERSPLTRVPT